jgi:hypothetical protein
VRGRGAAPIFSRLSLQAFGGEYAKSELKSLVGDILKSNGEGIPEG